MMFDKVGVKNFPTGHRGVGEEAVTIGLMNQLTETDCIHTSFRAAYCLYIKPGFTLEDVIGMYIGKLPNPYHPFSSPRHGTMATSGTLGESSNMYLGMAVANDIQKTGDITVYCQGDGASNRAPTHEAMATAAAWQMPVVFVIINNQYGMGTSVKKSYNIDDLSLRGLGYGMPSDRVDGNDMIAMYQVAKKHIDNARNGGGPSLIAADTYRISAHYEGDDERYRPDGEAEEWFKTKEPLARYQKQLMDMGHLTQADVDRYEKEVVEEVNAAVAAIEALPAPPVQTGPNTRLAVDVI
ncbi:MAG: thiamine pyrophosphate-dependent dehydrogenase E1 component subunit alpha [Proteobacteria bacterium]|nr:thiamine pyrophosphate-dependent dehydrogenase E1 component subunit alpha [Pseudomonadota bacterium]